MAVWAAHETEQLINLVRQNQTLYDPSSNDYRNREVLKTLWNNIANEMNRSGRIFISDMDCRDRWNSLRDGYRRFVKDEQALPSGSKPKKKKTWHWSEAMSFLKPYIQERTSTVSVTAFDSNTQKEHQGLKGRVVTSGELPVSGIVVTNNDLTDKSNYTFGSKVDNGPVERGESGVIHEDCSNNESGGKCASESRGKWQGMQVTSSSVELTSSSQPTVIATPPLVQDPDEQFFRSLLPDVKVLSPRKRGIFKIQVQQLLQEMLYPKDLAGHRMPPHVEKAHQPATAPSHVSYTTYSSVYPSERWSVNIQGGTGEYNKPHPS